MKESAGRAGTFLAGRPDWVLERISTLNLTNFRALFTMALSAWTAWRYMFQAKWGIWVPSTEWLGFLVVLGGLDITAYGIKRKTYNASLDTVQNATVPPQNVPPEGSTRADDGP